jgi:hypothetical protein
LHPWIFNFLKSLLKKQLREGAAIAAWKPPQKRLQEVFINILLFFCCLSL